MEQTIVMDDRKPWRLSPFIAVQNPNPRAAENWLILAKQVCQEILISDLKDLENQEPPEKPK